MRQAAGDLLVRAYCRTFHANAVITRCSNNFGPYQFPEKVIPLFVANLIEAFVFTGQEPLKDDVFKCLEARPSVLKAREIGERIVVRMKEYVEVFVKGMVA